MYKREQYEIINERLREPRKFIQVVMGPRQVGKTTVVRQVLKDLQSVPYLFFSADDVPATQKSWIYDCWDAARAQMRIEGSKEAVLIIDEIQKLKGWSEVVKKEWDEDTFNGIDLKVVLLGSSRVMLEKGLADSLMGRFETIKMAHWSYPEMKESFGIRLSQYIYFGGYPGAASLMGDQERWSTYVKDSIINATIDKDILNDTAIAKPALLRQTFELGASYSGKMVSLTKMLGSLQDAGNTTTLSGYLNLLRDSGLLAGLQKFSVDLSRQRASIPKFQVFNNALRNVYCGLTFDEAVRNPKGWGRMVESAVGAHLVNNVPIGGYEVYYWREGDLEVDYVLKKNDRIIAIEVKSGSETTNAGLEEIRRKYSPYASFIVGKGGVDIEKFLSLPPAKLFE
ncbi:MAG: ATP-binding protein [Bacteroidales bacterium]|jgi:predicted AAA+ superfamily ATPase|nr:ATP-binding protein [Bacteroidales bacterium]MCI2122106.1 ATP-binding protein [Bacteroidales bacterium]MCI2146337.1 ATP-binding protein [Bacteroidales bacterium]